MESTAIGTLLGHQCPMAGVRGRHDSNAVKVMTHDGVVTGMEVRRYWDRAPNSETIVMFF